MILALFAKGKKTIACSMLAMLYFETVIPAYAVGVGGKMRRNNERVNSEREYRKEERSPTGMMPLSMAKSPVADSTTEKTEDLGGPTQPESQAFQSVNNDKMVDLFSGDLNYSIPRMDVGGYPIAIGYNSGITMDQEASWVGLGWNINPGTITRNMRGLPDDFSGASDSIIKTATVKENKTIGVTAGADFELAGLPLNLGVSAGILHNSYRGWGMESGISASINAATSSAGSLTGGLSLTSSSQNGVTLSPSLSYTLMETDAEEQGGYGGTVSTGLSYNTRSGMKALQFSAGVRQAYNQNNVSNATGKKEAMGSDLVFGSSISFAYPSFTPTISLPYTSYMYTVTLKTGGEIKVAHPSLFISGYVSKQYIADGDKRMRIPAFGYLNYQNGSGNPGALLDFNREKEMAYREKPEVPNIAIPSYTYDVFSMSGEGTGGSFRAYRSDIGYVYDHSMKTKDRSGGASVDFGGGDLVHAGVDINFTAANTQSGPWKAMNPLARSIAFTKSDKNYEAVYFKNPGEKTINTRDFYDAIGGDYVVAPKLTQTGGSSYIATTNFLTKYADGESKGDVVVTPATAIKQHRDKRTQLISYLNAEEADMGALNKYIENYSRNTYTLSNCDNNFPQDELGKAGTGLWAEYWADQTWKYGLMGERLDPFLSFPDAQFLQDRGGLPGWVVLGDGFAIKWKGLIKAPVTGPYTFHTRSDDGAELWLEDIRLIDALYEGHWDKTSQTVYLEKDHFYNIEAKYTQWGGGKYGANLAFEWSYPGQPMTMVPTEYLYPIPKLDTFPDTLNAPLYKEKRVNNYRKKNHISEISVVNNDGKRYVYGIPVYNLKQKEVTFSVKHEHGDPETGLTKYISRLDPGHDKDGDDSTTNMNGTDRYFTSEETPAYAHSFLLTGVLSSDYVDVTGDGITDDDLGDAVKFNYTKMAGRYNPYDWRTPYSDSANYNEGLKSDTRDDKASYVYGQKELWYLNSIVSKNMIATFKLGARRDLAPINERGVKDTGYHLAQKLEEINLYTKADFLKHGTNARPIKTVHFDYSYELCKGINGSKNNYGKLTLKRIWFTYNGNNKGRKNPYIFKYHHNNPDYNTHSYDRWGNYKNALQNPGSSANNLITNAEYPYAIQDSTVAADNVAAWTLDTIVLPSGGRTVITYESDDYAYVQNRRAAQMTNIAGFSSVQPGDGVTLSNRLYGNGDHLYIAINVPQPVHTKEEVYNKYLEGCDTMFFRLNVRMPSDKFGRGSEYVSGYARLVRGEYGAFNGGKTIWVRVQGIDNNGNTGGALSPMAKAAIQFLRLNLPSKAYPGSDVGDNLDLADGVKVLFSMAANVRELVSGFDNIARGNGWARDVDLSRAFVRLNSPGYKKLGGGLRVKRVVINDNWNNMTGKTQKASTYGTEYIYTTIKNIHGDSIEISSGVAAYEPIMGNEENPWRQPIEYTEQAAALAPTNMGYVEQPLGESFFPAASVGYSKVRTRSIKTKNTRSANGYEDATFYTAYDFPTITDHSVLGSGNGTKRTYKPGLGNLLRINAAHHLVMSQGFKVELNDMHGKPRGHAVYAETDSLHPISYTENYYHVDNVTDEFKHLNNTVLSMNPQGEIDTAALIGKDVELMMDMREQRSSTFGMSANVNGDVFTFGLPPVLSWISLIPMPQSEENLFRSVAATKVITRHGILDSTVAVDKGSKVTTANLLYDGESGDVLLSAVQNEFGDSIYQFNYPAAWVYDGMSGAYKNIGFTTDSVNIVGGRITSGLTPAEVKQYFASGDEIFAYSRNAVDDNNCSPQLATFRSTAKIWAVDANATNGEQPDIYFMTHDGKPYTGNDLILKVIRSGRKNISASAGSVTMLANPLRTDATGKYSLVIDKDSKIINAAVMEYKQNWQVDDKKIQKITCTPNVSVQ